MIVADTCIIFHLFNETTLTDLARKVFEKDSAWIFPTIWKEEYANVLSKLARKENRNPTEVVNHFKYTENELKSHEIVVDVKKALKIALESKVSVYDAHFIALAIDHKAILVTEDKEILKNLSGLALSMKSFLE